MGGVRVCDLGMGDDDGKYVSNNSVACFVEDAWYFSSIEDDFMAWTTTFWQNVCQKYELVIDADGSS